MERPGSPCAHDSRMSNKDCPPQPAVLLPPPLYRGHRPFQHKWQSCKGNTNTNDNSGQRTSTHQYVLKPSQAKHDWDQLLQPESTTWARSRPVLCFWPLRWIPVVCVCKHVRGGTVGCCLGSLRDAGVRQEPWVPAQLRVGRERCSDEWCSGQVEGSASSNSRVRSQTWPAQLEAATVSNTALWSERIHTQPCTVTHTVCSRIYSVLLKGKNPFKESQWR